MYQAGELVRIGDAVRGALAAAEPDFLRLGGDLQRAVGMAQELTGTLESALLQAGRRPVQAWLAIFQEPLAGFARLRGIIETNRSGIEENAAVFTELARRTLRFQEVPQRLQIIALNTDVQSARSTWSRELFSGFVGELRALAGEIRAVIALIGEDITAALSRQTASSRQLKTELARAVTLVADAEVRFNRIGEDLSRVWADAVVAGDRAKTLARQVGEQAATIVVNLQYHDIARQQVGHIAEGLVEAERLLAAGERDGVALVALEKAQLAEVVKKLEKVAGRTEAAFAAFAKAGADLALRLGERGGLDTALDQLDRELVEFCGLFDGGKGLLQEMREAMEHAATAAGGFAGHAERIRTISQKLRLNAINASIMTGQLGGQGRAFSVLAREVQELASIAREYTGEADLLIRKILQANAAVDRDTLAEDRVVSCDNIQEELAGLHAFRDSYRHGVSGGLERVRELESFLGEVGRTTGFLPRLATDLGTACKALGGMLDALGGPEAGGADRERFAALAARYTMAREREVHSRVLGTGGETVAPDKEFGGNVELF